MNDFLKNRKVKIALQWLILVLLIAVLAYTLYQITTDLVVLKRRGLFSVSYRHRLFVISKPANSEQPGSIQSWMALRYINLVFHLPASYLKDQLNISYARYPNMSVSTLAKQQNKTSAEELMLVQQKVQAYLTIQPSATPTP